MLKCRECGHQEKDYLGNHLRHAHGMSEDAYKVRYPDADVVSDRLVELFSKEAPERKHPPGLGDLKIEVGGIPFPINHDVPLSACLPAPDHYRLPKHGKLSKQVRKALKALHFCRSTWISGTAGTGKDALFHYWSATTRTPGIIRQLIPGTDVEGWFFSRAFHEQGTYWEEGELLVALRDGYLTSTGRRIPYLIVFTDFDRADDEQQEYLRLITDTTSGRVMGPGGQVFPVLAGTRICMTSNTTGGGDTTGLYTTANTLDWSILDRIDRAYIFSPMDWKDEEPILKAKFPLLWDKVPEVGIILKNVTKAIRAGIAADRLNGEFGHRALMSVCGEATDELTLLGNRPAPDTLMREALDVWMNKLPDAEQRASALALTNAHLKGGTLPK